MYEKHVFIANFNMKKTNEKRVVWVIFLLCTHLMQIVDMRG